MASQMFCFTTQCNQNKIFKKPRTRYRTSFEWLEILATRNTGLKVIFSKIIGVLTTLRLCVLMSCKSHEIHLKAELIRTPRVKCASFWAYACSLNYLHGCGISIFWQKPFFTRSILKVILLLMEKIKKRLQTLSANTLKLQQ